eukprot:TRINITY_DN30441_c0_g1_i1.p3 TRINITY_DN30441_c0_g1~~TRINITY_DN30441_c0_g1_i1.p3  ORF type:complete len:172 (-),score=19.21 TRINITY_DN30441_c0_g1_i1:211-726(-)
MGRPRTSGPGYFGLPRAPSSAHPMRAACSVPPQRRPRCGYGAWADPVGRWAELEEDRARLAANGAKVEYADTVGPREDAGAATIFRPRTSPAAFMAAARGSRRHRSDRVDSHEYFQDIWSHSPGVHLHAAGTRSRKLGRPYESQGMLQRESVPLGLQAEHGGLPRWPSMRL